MISGPDSPFGPDVAEVPLQSPPLADVLSQVRFPPITSLARQDFLSGFQEAIRATYPVLRQEHSLGVLVTPEGISAVPQNLGSVLWRFSDVNSTWNVTVATNFIALETKRYESRTDFFDRLTTVLSAFEEHVRPGHFDRLGVRYINRLEGPDWLGDLGALIRPEVLGLLGGPPPRQDEALLLGQTAVQYRLGEGVMLVRTARLPSGAGYDPSVAPAAADSWILDLDMSVEANPPRPFSARALTDLGRSFSSSIYRYFRWSVLPELLQRSGAEQ